jgi:uncharacterized surface protein with fasciclin (FAS1) repeats
VVAGSLLLAACGGDDDGNAAADTMAAETTTTTAMPAETTAPAATGTIVDVASSTEGFSTLVSAVKAAGLADTLSGPGPFTVFAPTDDAFAALPAGTLDSLLQPENKDQLASILTYHVVPAEVMAKDVKAGPVKTVNGAEFTVSVDGGKVVITDAKGNRANVVKTDVTASNGVIHVIDAVLLPS